MIRKLRKLILSAVCVLSASAVFACAGLTAFAAEKPEIAAQGAVLYNASTGEFLYEKNADQRFYPASITKILTALLVLENCSLDEVVTFTEPYFSGPILLIPSCTVPLPCVRTSPATTARP